MCKARASLTHPESGAQAGMRLQTSLRTRITMTADFMSLTLACGPKRASGQFKGGLTLADITPAAAVPPPVVYMRRPPQVDLSECFMGQEEGTL